MNTIEKDILKVLISEAELKARVREIGARIAMDYENKDPLFVGVLRGSFMFFADLMRVCPIPCGLDFLAASSYKNATVSSATSRGVNVARATLEVHRLAQYAQLNIQAFDISTLRSERQRPSSLQEWQMPARYVPPKPHPAGACRVLPDVAHVASYRAASVRMVSFCSRSMVAPALVWYHI